MFVYVYNFVFTTSLRLSYQWTSICSFLPAFLEVVDRGMGIISLNVVKSTFLRLKVDKNVIVGKVPL